MEDGVTDAPGLLPPLNHNYEDCEQKEEGIEKVEKVREEDHDEEDCIAKDEEAKGSGGGGGLINNLISTLFTPLSPRTEHESGNEGLESEEGVAADGEKGGVVGNNGCEGGLISNLVSNLFHPSGGDGMVETVKDKEEEEEILVDEKNKRLKTENGANGDGGGGIIHNIVSHLPASIPECSAAQDDAVPTADEATFLINSLVRD